MLTYNEIIELKEQLENNEITLELAQEMYWKDFSEGKKSWHTKDWKERRDKVIKDKCQICDSTEILTLQHLSHPAKYNDYRNYVTRYYANKQLGSSVVVESVLTDYIIKNYEYFPTSLCPNCDERNPSLRVRKKPQYRCTVCKSEFDEPKYKSVEELIKTFYQDEDAIEVRDKCFLSRKWQNKHNLSSVKYWLLREESTAVNSQTIERESFLLYLEDTIKYLSFEDTITACKKCASAYDLYNMELCPKCKTHYKGIQYPTCIKCLPEDRQKQIAEQLAFNKEMAEINKNLGID